MLDEAQVLYVFNVSIPLRYGNLYMRKRTSFSTIKVRAPQGDISLLTPSSELFVTLKFGFVWVRPCTLSAYTNPLKAIVNVCSTKIYLYLLMLKISQKQIGTMQKGVGTFL